MTIAELNVAEPQAFVKAVGFAFEHSPWVAQDALEERPFENVDALHAAMVAALRRAPREWQVAVIRAHPDLAGRLARAGTLTEASRAEQMAAGLDVLTAAQFDALDGGNRAYRERFGFPFVICVREHDADGIIANLRERLQHERDEEIAAALDEIAKIARLRLADAVSE